VRANHVKVPPPVASLNRPVPPVIVNMAVSTDRFGSAVKQNVSEMVDKATESLPCFVADDLPRLLRRVADEIETRAIAPMELLDLTVSREITADGPWWMVTLYRSADGNESSASR
jgi:hypothetical protein